MAVVYDAVPLGIGTLIGLATRSRSEWTRWVTGPDPAPRAWDYLFQGERDGWVRIKLKTGPWIGGAYATYGEMKSYSAGYPEQQDIFLARSADLDPTTGEFQFEPDGTVRLGAGGLLVRWEEIEYLEYIDARGGKHGDRDAEDRPAHHGRREARRLRLVLQAGQQVGDTSARTGPWRSEGQLQAF